MILGGCFICCLMALWNEQYDYRYISVIYGYILFYAGGVMIRRKYQKYLFATLFLLVFIFLSFYKYTELWNMIRAASLVGFVYCSVTCQRLLSTKVFVWLGKLSLNIYLLQLFVIYSFTCRMADILDLNDYRAVLFVFISTLLLIILFSWVWSRVVDPIVEIVTRKTLSLLS